MEDIMLRGRWESNKTSRRYIQSGKALLLAAKVPAAVAEVARRAASLPAVSVLLCVR
jgi:hypothetical protein